MPAHDIEITGGLSVSRTIVVDAVSSILGGGITFTACLVNAMARLAPEWQFHIVASTQKFADQLDNAPNIHVHMTRRLRSPLSRLLWQQCILPFQAISFGADAILAQSPSILLSALPQVMLSLNSHLLIDPPLVRTALRATRVRFQRLLFSVGYRSLQRSVFLSNQMATLAKRWIGPGLGKSEIVYEGVNPHLLEFASRSRQKDNTHEKYLIAVGSIGYHKNYETMLRAFAKFVRAYPEPVRLKIVGRFLELEAFRSGKANIPSLVAMCEQLRIADRVDWMGEVFGEDLFVLYQNALAFISTSLLEAFPLTAIEAMSVGTPVIVPNTTSYPEAIANSGLYHDPEDPDSIANQMLLIARRPQIRSRYAKLGQRRASNFTWQRSAQKCLSILDDVSRSSPHKETTNVSGFTEPAKRTNAR